MGQGLDFVSTLPPLRRAKSLDRRTTDSVMTVSVSFISFCETAFQDIAQSWTLAPLQESIYNDCIGLLTL